MITFLEKEGTFDFTFCLSIDMLDENVDVLASDIVSMSLTGSVFCIGFWTGEAG
jgi:hypothetical protein